MSDMEEDELKMTKLFYGSITVYDLLEQWKQEYEIPLYEVDFVKDYIRGLENERKQNS